MYCAECGKRTEIKCCNGLGYWYPAVPLPQDAFKGQLNYKGYYLYCSLRWPKGKPFIRPNLEN